MQRKSENLTWLPSAATWEEILTMCPAKEPEALNAISNTLGFRDIRAYGNAARNLLKTNKESLEFVRSLFNDLFDRQQN